jgi:hypothetical protein
VTPHDPMLRSPAARPPSVSSRKVNSPADRHPPRFADTFHPGLIAEWRGVPRVSYESDR